VFPPYFISLAIKFDNANLASRRHPDVPRHCFDRLTGFPSPSSAWAFAPLRRELTELFVFAMFSRKDRDGPLRSFCGISFFLFSGFPPVPTFALPPSILSLIQHCILQQRVASPSKIFFFLAFSADPLRPFSLPSLIIPITDRAIISTFLNSLGGFQSSSLSLSWASYNSVPPLLSCGSGELSLFLVPSYPFKSCWVLTVIFIVLS